MYSDFFICLSKLFSFAYLLSIHYQLFRTHISFFHIYDGVEKIFKYIIKKILIEQKIEKYQSKTTFAKKNKKRN